MQREFSKENEIYSKILKDSRIKKYFTQVPFMKHINYIDVFCNLKRGSEDNTYSANEFYQDNIRRGLTFLEVEAKGVTICKKGLKKIYELKYEYIPYSLQEKDVQLKNEQTDKRILDILFSKPKELLERKIPITLYKSQKLDGENVQIGFNKRLNAWVIGSRTASVIAREESQLKVFRAKRNSKLDVSILAAEIWFNIIKTKFTGEKLEELKKDLDGKNLVGELVGHPLYENIIRYQDTKIIFYAITELHSNASCIPISTFLSFAEKYCLETAKIEKAEEYYTFKSLLNGLKDLYRKISESGIEEEGEGSVMYFQADSGKKVGIISHCKIMTLEYKIYSILKEKVQAFINTKDFESEFKGFSWDIHALCELYTPPKPLEYYINIAKLALEFILNNSAVVSQLDIPNRYIDFIHKVIEVQELNRTPQERDFANILDFIKSLKSQSKKNDGDDVDALDSIDDEEVKTEETQGEDTMTRDKRVVIIAPPFYLEMYLRQKIKEKFGIQEIETIWTEDSPLTSEKNIALLHFFPKVTKSSLRENTFFIIVGFDEYKKNLCSVLKKLKSLAENPNPDLKFFPMESLYIQSKDKENALKTLWSTVDNFVNKLESAFPNNYEKIDLVRPEKLLDHIESAFDKLRALGCKKPTSQDSNRKKILAIVPIGIPGMGKTTLIRELKKILEEKNCVISVISQDLLRKFIMDDLARKNRGLPESEIWKRATQLVKKRFFEEVEKAIYKTSELNTDYHLIFLDKGHPPMIIEETIQFFKSPEYALDYDIKVIVVRPDTPPYRMSDGDTFYPFSLNFLFTCIQRALSRDHETLTGDDEKKVGVVINFYNFYRNFRMRDERLRNFGANYILKLPFTNEDPKNETMYPKNLIHSIETLLSEALKGDAEPDKVGKFLKVFKKSQIKIVDPPVELLHKKTLEFLNLCFNLFEN